MGSDDRAGLVGAVAIGHQVRVFGNVCHGVLDSAELGDDRPFK
jgi:hypothetical protein